MINIDQKSREEFLKDSNKKELNIEVVGKKSIKEVNFMNTRANASILLDMSKGTWFHFSTHFDPYSNEISPYISKGYFGYAKYVRVSAYFDFNNIETLPDEAVFFVNYKTTNGSFQGNTKFKPIEGKNYYNIYITNTEERTVIDFYQMGIQNNSDTKIKANLSFGDMMVCIGDSKEELEEVGYIDPIDPSENLDDYLDIGTLENTDLETESFTLTESLCSQDNIKFGLCEAANCSFTAVNINGNFKDKVIKPFFINNAIRKEKEKRINGYKGNKEPELESKYYWTNVKAKNNYTINTTTISGFNSEQLSRHTFVKIRAKLKIGSIEYIDMEPEFEKLIFSISCKAKKVDGTDITFANLWGDMGDISIDLLCCNLYSLESAQNDFITVESILPIEYKDFYNQNNIETTIKKVYEIVSCAIQFRKSDGSKHTGDGKITFNATYKEIQICLIDDKLEEIPLFNKDDCIYYYHTEKEFEADYRLPLGIFSVENVKKQFERTITRKTITAYDNLVKLEQNAYDWYTMYMFGINTTTSPSRYGYEFARQIYSTFWNYCIKNDLDSRSNYTETRIGYWDYWNEIRDNHKSDKYIAWECSDPVKRVRYAYFTINDVDVNKRYMVDFTNPNGESDEEIVKAMSDTFFEKWDKFGRGIGAVASVLVDETRSNGNHNQFLCDKYDYFMLSPDCVSFTVYVPMYTAYDDGSGFSRRIDNVSIYRIEEPIDLENGHIRLLYYNYMQHNIFDVDTSITGRDVIRSLLEVCGCFFRLDRYYGRPEFVYCTKAGLYPSNKLYPSDDLFPRKLDGDTLSMGKYEAFEAEEYEVQNYGRIQIKRNDNSNETKSVCEWEYIGNNKEKNTYIIDDNIFYCNKEMIYEYDSMPEVSEMLKNMFTRISNMGYSPNQTRAIGMPYLECGDRIGLLTLTGGVQSFVFRRTLKGIQTLKDTYESYGDEYIPAIKNYGYSIWEK